MRAKLIEVQGDQEAYADLIGARGKLDMEGGPDGSIFFPDKRGDFLSMLVKDTRREGNLIILRTKLGNTFTFRLES